METKANYVLIGVFAVAGVMGMFGFLLWIAKVEVSRQYAYYDVLFDNVAGLGSAGDVRFNGLPVGQVVSLELDSEDPSKVRVRLEVAADTPVKTDTEAVLQAQGVTGVSYVGLSGGSPDADPLPQFGVIRSRRSPLQSIFEGAPELLNRAISLLEDIQLVVNQENRDAVAEILQNLSNASGRLDRALEDFETLSADLGNASRAIAGFTERLDQLSDTAEVTLNTATDAINETRTAAVATLDSAKGTIEDVKAFIAADLADFITRGTEMVDTANRVVEQIGTDFAGVSGSVTAFSDDGRVALERATETFANANETLADISTAMDSAYTTLETANTTFASANKVINEDLGSIIADVREAATAFTTTVNKVAGNVDEISAEILSASQSAADLAGTVDGIVQDNRRQVSDFMRVGLPQFQRFIEESRRLVINLERLVDRVERDPARFLLGTQASEYRQ